MNVHDIGILKNLHTIRPTYYYAIVLIIRDNRKIHSNMFSNKKHITQESRPTGRLSLVSPRKQHER